MHGPSGGSLYPRTTLPTPLGSGGESVLLVKGEDQSNLNQILEAVRASGYVGVDFGAAVLDLLGAKVKHRDPYAGQMENVELATL